MIDNTNNNNNNNKMVGFDSRVEVWEFPIVLGDNPFVSAGPPIAISRFPKRQYFTPLKPIRRYQKSRRLTQQEREDFLLLSGYSVDQIQMGTMKAEVERMERILSLQELRLQQQLEQQRDYQKSQLKRPMPAAADDADDVIPFTNKLMRPSNNTTRSCGMVMAA